MIEDVVRDYLNLNLKVSTYLEKPKNTPKSYVIIEKIEESVTNHLYHATMAIQSYAQTMFESSVLNEQVKLAMNGLVLIDEVTKSKLNTDYNDTDTAQKEYRYMAVYDIYFY